MNRQQILACYARAVAPHEGIEIKGAKSAYTALNGNMFSFVDDTDRLCLRLSEPRKAEVNAQNGTGDVMQYGAVMRGYIAVPDAVAEDQGALQKLFDESLAFAKTLKPKPTKKARKS